MFERFQQEEGLMGTETFRNRSPIPALSASRSWQPVVLEGSIVLRRSQWQINGEPTECRFCNQPFPIRENRAEAYHVQKAGYFCDTGCAEAYLGPERAKSRRRRAA